MTLLKLVSYFTAIKKSFQFCDLSRLDKCECDPVTVIKSNYDSYIEIANRRSGDLVSLCSSHRDISMKLRWFPNHFKVS